LPEDPEIAPSPEDLQRQALTERAFSAYLGRDFSTAASLYGDLARDFPKDPIGEMFVRRCEDLRKTPPGPEWSGVTHLKEK
jgi:hypothetical protein